MSNANIQFIAFRNSNYSIFWDSFSSLLWTYFIGLLTPVNLFYMKISYCFLYSWFAIIIFLRIKSIGDSFHRISVPFNNVGAFLIEIILIVPDFPQHFFNKHSKANLINLIFSCLVHTKQDRHTPFCSVPLRPSNFFFLFLIYFILFAAYSSFFDWYFVFENSEKSVEWHHWNSVQ